MYISYILIIEKYSRVSEWLSHLVSAFGWGHHSKVLELSLILGFLLSGEPGATPLLSLCLTLSVSNKQ